MTERHRAGKNGHEGKFVTRPDQQARVAQLGLYALGNPALLELMDEAVRSVSESLDVEFCHVLLLQGDAFLLEAG